MSINKMDSNSKLKWILISTVILCVLLAFFLLICLLRDRWDNTAAIDDSEGEMRLTTEETFGLFFGGSSVAYLHLFSRASPQSLKLLRYFMRRGDLGRFSTINGIFLMAYLGSSEDQQWLMETYFHGFRGQLDENERDLAFALFDAFGEFHRRGVKNSPVYFEQFTSVDYWEAEDFRLFPPRPTTGVPVPLATATVALRAYASFERLEEVISKGQEILTEISDGRLRNYMENQIGENALKGRSRIKS